MESYEIPALVREIMRQELAQIMMGVVTATTDKYRGTLQRFPTEVAIPNARLIQQYGIASRPKDQMTSLIVPVGGDPTHLNIVGQFDPDRPMIEENEVALYGPDGQKIHMKNGGNIHAETEADLDMVVAGDIHQGSLAADEPVVLGNVLREMLGMLIDLLTTESPAPKVGIDSFGLPVYLDPQIVTALLQLKLKYVTQPTTNIVGQRNFVERGDA